MQYNEVVEFEWDDVKALSNFKKHRVRFSEEHMKKEYDFSKAKRAKKAKDVKVIKTFRMDPEVLEWLEAQGEEQGMGYQTFLNWFLRKSMAESITIEDRLQKLEEAIFKKKA